MGRLRITTAMMISSLLGAGASALTSGTPTQAQGGTKCSNVYCVPGQSTCWAFPDVRCYLDEAGCAGYEKCGS